MSVTAIGIAVRVPTRGLGAAQALTDQRPVTSDAPLTRVQLTPLHAYSRKHVIFKALSQACSPTE